MKMDYIKSVKFKVPNMFQYGKYRGLWLCGKITKINKKTYEVTHRDDDKNLMICALIKKEDLESWNLGIKNGYHIIKKADDNFIVYHYNEDNLDYMYHAKSFPTLEKATSWIEAQHN